MMFNFSMEVLHSNFMKIKLLIPFVIILFIASVLRLWNLSSNPPHLTPDEAALGYNAYSILKTGKDEYGIPLPIIFKSFGDYKPGLYVYLTIPSVAILGLNEFSTRLPSAIAGIFAVWLIYFIVQELVYLGLKSTNFNSTHDTTHSLPYDQLLPLFTSFILAVSPWHIQFSRGAWEVNVALTLALAGTFFFLKSVKTSIFIIPSGIFFASTLLAYQGAKLSTSLVILILTIVFYKEIYRKLLANDRWYYVVGVILGGLIALPILLSFGDARSGRLTVFSVFNYPRPEKYLQDFLDQGDEQIGSLSYYLFHSETYNFIRGVIGRYFNHFSGRFLFFEGDWQNPRHTPPNHGVLLLGDLLFILIGCIGLIKLQNKKLQLFILLWLLLAPFPSVLSRDQVHAVRALNMVIPWSMIIALGVVQFVQFASNQRMAIKTLSYILLGVSYFISLIYFIDAYTTHQPTHNAKYWEYGYKEIVETITPIQKNYSKITVQQSFAQPYIYFLFYQQYDPVTYQQNAKLVESEYKGDVGYITKLDNICFCPIDWSVSRGEHQTLVIGDPVRIPPVDSSNSEEFRLIQSIKYPIITKAEAFRIVEIK